MKRSDIIEISNKYKLFPNKKLGQNFLVSASVIEKICKAIELNNDDDILEIGPGLGALTEKLIEIARNLIVVEIDSGFVNYLNQKFLSKKNFKLIHSDFLKVELNESFTKIVSNLPYYCASEILFKIALECDTPEVYVMLQKEMAERILAKPGSKSYGALTVTLGYYFKPKILFDIKRESFFPRPDVSSSFISLIRRKNLPLNSNEQQFFHLLVKSAFWGRRKTLLKALSSSPHLDFKRYEIERILENSGIEFNIRGETLSTDDYIRIAKSI